MWRQYPFTTRLDQRVVRALDRINFVLSKGKFVVPRRCNIITFCLIFGLYRNINTIAYRNNCLFIYMYILFLFSRSFISHNVRWARLYFPHCILTFPANCHLINYSRLECNSSKIYLCQNLVLFSCLH